MERTVGGRDDRRLVRPVLVETALLPEQRVDKLWIEWAEPAEKHQQVVAGDHRSRVQLQAAESAHQVVDGVRSDRRRTCATQALTRHRKAPCTVNADRSARLRCRDARYLQTSAAVSAMRRSFATSSW